MVGHLRVPPDGSIAGLLLFVLPGQGAVVETGRRNILIVLIVLTLIVHTVVVVESVVVAGNHGCSV